MSETIVKSKREAANQVLPDLSAHALMLEVFSQLGFNGSTVRHFLKIQGPGIEAAEPALRELGFRYNPITGFWMTSASVNLVRMADLLPNGVYPKARTLDPATAVAANQPAAGANDEAATADIQPILTSEEGPAGRRRLAPPPPAPRAAPGLPGKPAATIGQTPTVPAEDEPPPFSNDPGTEGGLFGGLLASLPSPPELPAPTTDEVVERATPQISDQMQLPAAEPPAPAATSAAIPAPEANLASEVAQVKPVNAPPPQALAPRRPRPDPVGLPLFEFPRPGADEFRAVQTVRAPGALPQAAIAPGRVLGVNSQGATVEQLPDGRRCLVNRDGTRLLEDPLRPPGYYLRAQSQADLVLVAESIVSGIEKGQQRTSADIRRMASIITGNDGTAPPAQANIAALVEVIDNLMLAKIDQAEPASRQRAMAARFHRFSAQGWPDLDLARDSIPMNRALAELGGVETFEPDVMDDAWVAETLAPRLATLADNQRVVIRLNGTPEFGDTDFRGGPLSDVISTNILEGIAQTLPPLALWSATLIVFGPARPEPIVPAEVPAEAFQTQKLNSPETAWEWLDRVEGAAALTRAWTEDYRAGRVTKLADVQRPANQYQSPYIGLSKGEARNLMVPTALAAATKEGLDNLALRLRDVDDYVARQAGVTVEHLLANFTGPQIDAAALNMDAHDRNRGFLLGDSTGAGKTRSLALIAKRGVMSGKNVIFMTEKAASFGDIIKEFQRCGLADGINWFIMNNNVEVQTDEVGLAFTISEKAKREAAEKGYRVGEQLVPSRKATEIKRALYDEEGAPVWPAGVNILLTTYSQAALSTKGKPKGKLSPRQIEVWQAEVAKAEWKANWFKGFDASNTLAIFDEVHNLTNPNSVTNSNLISLIGRAEKVTYSTATSGNEAKQMAVYYRMMPGSPEDARALLPKILSRGGLEASEALSVAFVADGVARRCGLDFSDVVVKVLVSPNSKAHRETLYSLAPTLQGMLTLARVMSSVIQQQNTFEAGKERLRVMAAQNLTPEQRIVEWKKGVKRGAYRAMGFSSPIYAIERAFAAVILAREFGEYAVDLLQSGKKPVIQIDNTMQTVLEDVFDEALMTGVENGEARVVPTMRHFLRRMLEQMTRIKQGEQQIDIEVLEQRQLRTSELRGQASIVLVALAEVIEQTDAATPFESLEALRDWLDTALAETVSARRVNYEAAPQEATENNLDAVFADGDGQAPEVAAPAEESVRLAANDWRDVEAIAGLLLDQTFDTLVVTAQDVSATLRAEAATLELNRDISAQRQITENLISSLPAEADLPISYIDVIKETVAAAGFQMLEMTNRRLEARDGVIRSREPEEVAVIKHQFQSTVGAGLIIGSAGAASIGLHAAPDAQDQSQRIFVPLQVFANPNRQQQILGRVKRAGEVNAPELHYFFSGTPAEARHVSMMNRKFARLGANTEASRLSPVMIANVPDFHSAEGDRASARFLLDNPEMVTRLGIDITEAELLKLSGRVADPVIDEEAEAGEVGDQDDQRRGGTPMSATTREHQRLGNEVLMAATVLGRDQEKVLDGVSEQYWALLEEYEAQGLEVGGGHKIDGKVIIRGECEFEPTIPPREGDPPSVFDKAITLNTILIQRDIQAVRGNEILGLVDQAAMSGAGRSFYNAAMERQQAADRKELARNNDWDAGNDLRARSAERLRRQSELLLQLQPGFRIEPVSYSIGAGVILRATGEGEFSQRLEAIFPGDSKPRSLVMPAALDHTTYRIDDGLLGPEREAILAGFDNAENRQSCEVRYLLTGSEPRMLALNLGRFTTFDDGSGVQKRGMLIAKRFERLDRIRNIVPTAQAVMNHMIAVVESNSAELKQICTFNLVRGAGAGSRDAGNNCVDLDIHAVRAHDNVLFRLRLSNFLWEKTEMFKLTYDTFATLREVAGGDVVNMFLEHGPARYGLGAIAARYEEYDVKRLQDLDSLVLLEAAGEEVPADLLKRINSGPPKVEVVTPDINIAFTDPEAFPALAELIIKLYDVGFRATRYFPAKFDLKSEQFLDTMREGGDLGYYGLREVSPAPPRRRNLKREAALATLRANAIRDFERRVAGADADQANPNPDLFNGP